MKIFIDLLLLEWPAIFLAAALWGALRLKDRAYRRRGLTPADGSLSAKAIVAFILAADFLVLGYLAYAPYRYACDSQAQTLELALLAAWAAAAQPTAMYMALRFMDAAKLPPEVLSQQRTLARRMNLATVSCFTALFLSGAFFQFGHPVSLDFPGCPGLTRIDAANLVIDPKAFAPEPPAAPAVPPPRP